MTQFIVGTIFGIVIATVGVSGLANIADQGVAHAKVVVQEAANK